MTQSGDLPPGFTRSFRDRVFDTVSATLGRSTAKFLFKLYDLARFDLFGRPKYNFGSVDITYRCNLKCKHCYFLEQGYQSELSDEEWIDHFRRLKDQGFPFYQCSWVGGEPLLRKDLIARLMRLFKSNVVATNGTIPLPDWPDVNFYVSVDGTESYYRQMRGRDFYHRIKATADRPDLRVIAAMVISKTNYTCIRELLDEWSETRVKAILFQFYTPIKGHTDDLWPGWTLRDEILDQLIELKGIYGNFIDLPVEVFRLMKSDKAPEVTRNCLYRTEAFCFDPMGRVKKPCMMGPKADCSRCGCVLPFHLKLLDDRSLMLREVMRTLGDKFGAGRKYSRPSRIARAHTAHSPEVKAQ